MANDRTPYMVVKNRFCTSQSKLRQIFCLHEWEMHREIEPRINSECYFTRCKKCGKFKEIYYYRWRER